MYFLQKTPTKKPPSGWAASQRFIFSSKRQSVLIVALSLWRNHPEPCANHLPRLEKNLVGAQGEGPAPLPCRGSQQKFQGSFASSDPSEKEVD
jgi:hypothetical protein